MSFFSWKSSPAKGGAPPTGGIQSQSGNRREEADDKEGRPRPLSAAAGPPPTFFSSPVSPQSPRQGPPLTTSAYGRGTSSKSATAHRDATPALPSKDPSVRIFVPQAAPQASSPQGSDRSWVEMAAPETSESPGTDHDEIPTTRTVNDASGESPHGEYGARVAPSGGDSHPLPVSSQGFDPPLVTSDDWSWSETQGLPIEETAEPSPTEEEWTATAHPVPIQENSSQPAAVSARNAPVEDWDQDATAASQKVPVQPVENFEWVMPAPPLTAATINTTKMVLHSTNPPSSASASALVVSHILPPFTAGVQTNLNQLQEKTKRRQHEVRTRIHGIQCQMARFTANLAAERMERDGSMQGILTDCVYDPAGRLTERVSLLKQDVEEAIDGTANQGGGSEQDGDDDSLQKQPHWRSVESRLTALETQMTLSVHKLAEDRREKLNSLQDRLVYDVLPRLAKDQREAQSRDALLMRQVDRLSGVCAVRLHQERAARQASTGLAMEDMHASEQSQEERQQGLLQHLVHIRDGLDREQTERKKKDVETQQQLVDMADALNRAFLEAVGDPED